MQGSIYLFPVTLGDSPISHVIPDYNAEMIRKINFFIVENLRTARRFLKKTDPSINIDNLTFYELNKHTDKTQLEKYIRHTQDGFDIGIMSEAGCPGIADPGADVIAIAQQKGIKIVPLVGPSSILLSLMGSGFNGQSFAFHGYLPIDSNDKAKKIKQMENRIYNEDQTQIFIETPYRNEKLVNDLIKNCSPSTKLCIAVNLTTADEYIKTMSVRAWAKHLPDMHKKPAIFLLYK